MRAWIVVGVAFGLAGCESQQDKDCKVAWDETVECSSKAMRHRDIASGPEREAQLEAWRGDLRVCAGLAEKNRLETPAVQDVLAQYAAVYAAAEPKCTDAACVLEVPKDKLAAAQAAQTAACPP